MKTLILVDIQNDFMPGGALGAPNGNEILDPVNAWIPKFDLVVATQDWHPTNHKSFASQHPDTEPFSTGELNGLEQIFWPDHCVQWTAGPLFAPGLDTRNIARVFPKGTDPEVDSYSGFHDNGHRKSTGLADWLRDHNVTTLHIVGLATDFCVKYTALDAAREGFNTHVLLDGCRGIYAGEYTQEDILNEMQNAGVNTLSGDPFA